MKMNWIEWKKGKLILIYIMIVLKDLMTLVNRAEPLKFESEVK